jgi:hypothetical protein
MNSVTMKVLVSVFKIWGLLEYHFNFPIVPRVKDTDMKIAAQGKFDILKYIYNIYIKSKQLSYAKQNTLYTRC